MKPRVLTGITTTGTPHLGNYVGAIRPAIAASLEPGVESFLFLADYHALIKCDDPDRIERSRLEIAATWLAAGLDPQRVAFYRQSDIPETPELTWLLTCVTPKGLMNRAHAYKAATDVNEAAGEEIDAGVTMGLFSYPILMAADILLFNAHRVPVGRDQVQHIEMARDIAQRFNHLFGQGHDLFVLPQAEVEALWREITCPSLLVYGKESWASDPRGDGRASHFQNASIVSLAGAGHWVHHDQLETFMALVDPFIRAEPLPTGLPGVT